MQTEPNLSEQITALWRDSGAWLVGHSSNIAISAIIGAFIVALLCGVRVFGKRLSRSAHPWRGVIGRALSSMRFWFMGTLAAQIVSVFAHAPPDIANTVNFIFTFALTFQVALFLRELLIGSIELRAGHADPSGSLPSAINLIRLLINATLFIIAVILILGNLNVNVTGLIAGLGVGGIAIGLAAQGIFSDLFAALAILFDQPFRRGDSIKWENTIGTVEAIGLKTTRIRTNTGELAIVSNTNLLSKEMRNFSRLDHRRVVQMIGIKNSATAEQLAALPEQLRAALDGCEGCRFIACGIDSFVLTAINIQLSYDVLSPDGAQLLTQKHAAHIALLRSLEAAGIALA